MTASKWTSDRCQEISKYCEAGHTYSKAAKHFGVDPATIRRALRKAGTYQSRATQLYSEAELDVIQSLLNQGKTAKQISVATGRPVAGLHSLMRRVFAVRGASRGRPDAKSDASKENIVTERGFGNSSKYLSCPNFMRANP